jgi:UDP-glucose 4-epimerase
VSDAPLTWVVGAGGLLGSHVVRALPGPAWSAAPVPWGTPAAPGHLSSAAKHFVREADGRPWSVLWCAGAGVTGTGEHELRKEADALQGLLAGLPGNGSQGSFFLASSAGGVYAGAEGPPFDEHSPVRPLSPYGETKLSLERAVREWSEATNTPVLVGRIANLYGPGQNMAKPQGLVSHICRAHLLRRPVSIYVSLDTLRDYLYTADCARLVVAGTERARALGGVHTKVLASQQGYTIGALLAEIRRLSRRSPQVELAVSSLGRLQSRDLRMRSRVWTDLDHVPLTPLPVGLLRTMQALTTELQSGRLR